jgi:DNA-binding NtrC family response regulator
VRELRNVAERLVLRAKNGRIDMDSLPPEVLRRGHVSSDGPVRPELTNVMARTLFRRLLERQGSFWSEVYEPFMARDLTRHDMRELVRLGLEHTRGNYKLLVTSFNMPQEDYKKFLNFLRKYQCHVPFQRFRMMPSTLQEQRDGEKLISA